jgi:hypothetical protein
MRTRGSHRADPSAGAGSMGEPSGRARSLRGDANTDGPGSPTREVRGGNGTVAAPRVRGSDRETAGKFPSRRWPGAAETETPDPGSVSAQRGPAVGTLPRGPNRSRCGRGWSRGRSGARATGTVGARAAEARIRGAVPQWATTNGTDRRGGCRVGGRREGNRSGHGATVAGTRRAGGRLRWPRTMNDATEKSSIPHGKKGGEGPSRTQGTRCRPLFAM